MDIVLTIPKSEYANDDAETKHMLSDPDLQQFWTLSKTPNKLKTGDRVYFVKRGRIESSMRVSRIAENNAAICETTRRAWSGKCQIFMDDLRFETFTEYVKGFQGFRYRWW